MIGLQLWLPAFFLVGFLLCFVIAFHAPSFQNIPVAVVGSSSQVEETAAQLTAASDGAVAAVGVSDLSAAEAGVEAGTYAAAFVPEAFGATLVVASAQSEQLANFAKTYFGGVTSQTTSTLSIEDLAPLPAWDTFGTSLFYITLVCTITGFMVAMFIGLMGAGLKLRVRVALFASTSIVLPGIAILLGRFAIHAMNGNFWHLWAIGSAVSFSVGCVVNGLAYYMEHYIPAGAIGLFIFLNVPSSGGAFPQQIVPQPFRFLHDYVNGTAGVNLFRHAVYGVGPAPWQGWLLIAAYVVTGMVLAITGKRFQAWKGARNKRIGRRPGMMATAQIMGLVRAGHVVHSPGPGDVRVTGSPDAEGVAADKAALERALAGTGWALSSAGSGGAGTGGVTPLV
jgi:hypothetical protein